MKDRERLVLAALPCIPPGIPPRVVQPLVEDQVYALSTVRQTLAELAEAGLAAWTGSEGSRRYYSLSDGQT